MMMYIGVMLVMVWCICFVLCVIRVLISKVI